MPSSETDPKPREKPDEKKDVQHSKELDKNVDRDGRERHPTEQTGRKS